MIYIKDLKHFAFLLKCKTNVAELNNLFTHLSTDSEKTNWIYYGAYIKKKRLPNGHLKRREINPSKGRLKFIQKKLTQNILSQVQLLECVHGGRKGRSNVTNASKHKNSIYKFTTDIKNFYPTITPVMTYKALLNVGFNPKVAVAITRLSTFKGKLPQGAPTSTYISNIVLIKLDQSINEHATSNNLIYTRYIDDITLSGNSDFKHLIPEFVEIINNNGFTISARKTHYKRKIDITGVEVGKAIFKPDQKFFLRYEASNDPVQKSAMENYMNFVIEY